MRNSISIN
jgi:hypothetical protein